MIPTAFSSIDALLQAANIPFDFLPGERLPVFSMSNHICPKPDLLECLYLPSCRAHVGLSLALPRAFAS
jgi:hypothetical protein